MIPRARIRSTRNAPALGYSGARSDASIRAGVELEPARSSRDSVSTSTPQRRFVRLQRLDLRVQLGDAGAAGFQQVALGRHQFLRSALRDLVED